MRALVLLLPIALLVAGCAEPETGAPPTATPVSATPLATPTATAPTSSVTPTQNAPSPPSDGPTLGVVLDETHDFSMGGQNMSFFNVTGGEKKVVIFFDSAGPPADRSFTSAVVQFYFPGTTSPFLAELPGQEKRNFTIEQQPHLGMWRIVYDGVGKTSVHVRVTLE